MNYRQLFFIGNQFLTDTRRTSVVRHATLCPPTSDLYFCTTCGEVFARCPCLGADGSTTPWQSYAALCEKCGKHSQAFSLFEVPGSIYRPWDIEFTRDLPPAILRREVLLHLNYFPESLSS